MLLVALLLAMGQQFSGVNAVNAYFPTMLIALGFATQAALLAGVVLGVTKFVFTAWWSSWWTGGAASRCC